MARAENPVFSPDGAHVAFDVSRGDSAELTDVYVRDLTTGTTTLATVHATPSGCDATSVPGQQPTLPVAFSPEGTRLLIDTPDSDLGPVDRNDEPDIYMRDLSAGTTSLVSTAAGTSEAANSETIGASFSPDGTKVLLISRASDFGPLDRNGVLDVYLRDLATGTTRLVSVRADGTESGNFGATAAVFNHDGTKVLFDSQSDNLVPVGVDLATSPENVYLRDLITGTTTLVSVSADGVHGGNGVSHAGHFVAGDQGVVFDSEGDNFGPRDSHRTGNNSGHDDLDVYYRDLRTGTTRLVTLNAAGDDSADGLSFMMNVSSDGTTVGFMSLAGDFGPTDTPKSPELEYDAYVARFGGEADLSIRLSAAPEPVPSGGSLTYNLQLANAGPDASHNVTTALLLPEGTTFQSATASAGACTQPTAEQPRLVVCHVGDLDNGGTANIQVTAHVTATPGAQLTAVAAVDSTTGDGGNGPNTATANSTIS